jgi:ATP-binding cassette subfamily B protein
VRVWGIADYFLDQIAKLRRRFRAENIALSRSQALAAFGGELLATLGYYGAYITVVAGVFAGRLTLGDLTLYAGMFSRAQSLFDELMRALAEMHELHLFSDNLARYLALVPSIVTPDPLPLPSLAQGIAVKGVSFRYPDTDAWVLRDLSFAIQPGECVAIVGSNGAGKTTLVKCLLRLYDPQAGAIEAGGMDLRRMDPARWRGQIGVVFQDYARYQLSVRENIGVGHLDQIHNPEAIRDAATRAGIAPVLERLPDGYETLLGRQFEGGMELSLGQWQRLALARALLREAPFLILDEPTAAMDAQAEYELYRHFRTLAQGRMTLLISHRFSTVRMADRILVLENGQILEEGTHESLLSHNGRYAELFTLQAESYQPVVSHHNHQHEPA